MEYLELILPEIFISLSIMFLLILGVFKKKSSKLIQNISLIVLLITAVIIFNETISMLGIPFRAAAIQNVRHVNDWHSFPGNGNSKC